MSGSLVFHATIVCQMRDTLLSPQEPVVPVLDSAAALLINEWLASGLKDQVWSADGKSAIIRDEAYYCRGERFGGKNNMTRAGRSVSGRDGRAERQSVHL